MIYKFYNSIFVPRIHAATFSDWDGINRVETDPPVEESTDETPIAVPPDPPSDDVAKLKAALEKERQVRKEAEKAARQLKALEAALGDTDPEKLAEMRANAERLQRVEDERAQLEAQITARYEQEKQEALEAERRQLRTAQQELEALKLETACRDAYINAGGRPEAFADFYAIVSRQITKDQQGEYRVQEGGKTLYLNNEPWLDDDDPRKGKPYSIADLMESASRSPIRSPYFRPKNQSSGSGVFGGGYGASSDKPKDPKQLRAWARKQGRM